MKYRYKSIAFATYTEVGFVVVAMLMIGRFVSEMAELNQSSAICRDGCRSWMFREYWVYLLEIVTEFFIAQIRFPISRLRVQDSESSIFSDDEVISSKHIRKVTYNWRSVLQTFQPVRRLRSPANCNGWRFSGFVCPDLSQVGGSRVLWIFSQILLSKCTLLVRK